MIKRLNKFEREKLKERMIEQLDLLINGFQFRNPYVGLCETYYKISTKKTYNVLRKKYRARIKISVVPRATIC